MNNTGKYIVGTLMLLLAVAIYYFGKNMIQMSNSCTGFGWINPICWFSATGDAIATVLALIIAIYTAIYGIAILIAPVEKTFWIVGLYLFSFLFILDLIIPDVLPFIDEIVLFFVTGLFGIKSFGGTSRMVEKIKVF